MLLRLFIISSNIKHIINFDLPCEIGHYRERIGRTGQVGTRGEKMLCENDIFDSCLNV